jgi:eukaryotic-like serine/threonine-protein kinase
MNTPPPRPAADAMIGHVIEEKYRLDARLGAGGMGTVYRATRLMIGDAVAVKVLHPAQVADAQAAERFRREAQAAARLKHPNAVTIYDFGVSREGLVYLVMELVEGRSLREVIRDGGPLTLPAAAEILNQACAALDEAHRQHIVHRDLKPDNIIVHTADERLRVKVLDFGIAKLRDLAATNLTQTGTVMGTPHYMSPEQCLGEELDGRSDVYSLGVVLYEMLTGIVPFNSPTSTAVVVQHVSQPPPAPSAINLSIPQTVERVVLRALAKRREERPQTAAELAQGLTAAVTHATSVTRPDALVSPTPPSGTTRTAGHDPALAATQVVTTPASGRQPLSFAPMTEAAERRLNPLWLTVAAVLVLAAVGAALWLLVGRGKTSAPDGAKETAAAVTPPPGMAYVPGGEFTMGSGSGDEFERPAHRVTVRPFFIDLREVSCEEYEKFLRATGRAAPAAWRDGELPPGAARRPVTGVTWDDAQAYAAWAGKRLPTEAEWEFAARGTDGRLYPWGNEWESGHANAGTTAVGHLADVGAHAAGASPYGVLDLAGNAWEWTASDLTAYPGGELPAERPPGELKVIRGGCWRSSQNQATATFRRGWPMRGADDYGDTGFRCARDLAPPPVSAMTPAAAPTPVVDNSLVGIIRNAGVVDGCGCYFNPAAEQEPNSTRYVFLADMDEENAWMNIDAKDVKLRLVGRTDAPGDLKVGSRFSRRYAAGQVTVSVESVVTRVCPPDDEGCEVTDYGSTIVVTKDNRTQTIKASGGCGC